MDSPYEYNDITRPRFVTNVDDTRGKVTAATGIIWGVSTFLYVRKVLRVDSKPINFAAFTALSVPAAYGYAKTFCDSATNEAAAMNNERE